MENLISLIIEALTALFSNSKKGSQGDPSPPANRPDPSRPRPSPQPASWENELRRLLEGQNPPAAAPPPLRPPPARVITVTPQPATSRPAPAYAVRTAPVLTPPPLPVAVTATRQQLASLNESQQAYTRASQLDTTAAARIERVPGQAVQLTTVVRKAVSPEIAQVVSMFKNARAARQAVIASVIFGAPRAFDEPTSSNF